MTLSVGRFSVGDVVGSIDWVRFAKRAISIADASGGRVPEAMASFCLQGFQLAQGAMEGAFNAAFVAAKAIEFGLDSSSSRRSE